MHIPLRNNTANQARSISDLYQQQVLNNLAMFVQDPNSLPHFSYVNMGASGIEDQNNGTLGLGFTNPPFNLAALTAGFFRQRTGSENFTMTPVNDPRKLELMRCAYQKALAGCGRASPSETCPDCETRFKIFYTGTPDGNIRASANGAVTSECLGNVCWFAAGCKKCIPKNCSCSPIGSYCGVYVWVLPGGQDELAKLTLAILDYAQNAPPQQVTKTVEYYLDERGLPTPWHKAVSKVTAQIGVTERNESLLSLPRDDEVSMRDDLEAELAEIKNQIADAQAKNQTTTLEPLLAQKESIEAKLRYLDVQLSSGGLKEEYRQGFTPPSGPGLLFLNQSLNAASPFGR
jgi:hypothetical protein